MQCAVQISIDVELLILSGFLVCLSLKTACQFTKSSTFPKTRIVDKANEVTAIFINRRVIKPNSFTVFITGFVPNNSYLCKFRDMSSVFLEFAQDVCSHFRFFF